MQWAQQLQAFWKEATENEGTTLSTLKHIDALKDVFKDDGGLLTQTVTKENARAIIREAAEDKLPTAIGKKAKKSSFERLKARNVKAAESLGMTGSQYESLINKNLTYPLGKLFPSLFRTPYAASAEHIYPLQQAIATNMVGELKAGSKAIVPSTKKLNLLVKGHQLDAKATSQ